MSKWIQRVIFLWAASFAIMGCERNTLSPSDPLAGSAPLVRQIVLTPDSVNIDHMIPVGGSYVVSTVVTAGVVDPDGSTDIASVTASILRPRATDAFLSVLMKDDGIPPDMVAGDSIYTANLSFSLGRAQTGPSLVRVEARDRVGRRSGVEAASFFITRQNSAPTVSNLMAPDTVTVPVGGATIFQMTIAAADSDGLADVMEVFFVSPDGQNPTFRFQLRDDGGSDPNVPSGDAVAGDGIYSILLPVSDSPTVHGTYRFLFQALDSFADTSASLLHRITIN